MLIAVAVANIFIAPKDEPFFGGNGIWQQQNFNVENEVIDSSWIEAAPILLAKNFKSVSLENAGDRFVDGIGFSQSLVDIYEMGVVDRENSPLQLSVSAAEFQEFIQFESDVHCTRAGSKYCDLFIAWDPELSPAGTTAVFQTVVFDDYLFGIIEAGLIARVEQ